MGDGPVLSEGVAGRRFQTTFVSVSITPNVDAGRNPGALSDTHQMWGDSGRRANPLSLTNTLFHSQIQNNTSSEG